MLKRSLVDPWPEWKAPWKGVFIYSVHTPLKHRNGIFFFLFCLFIFLRLHFSLCSLGKRQNCLNPLPQALKFCDYRHALPSLALPPLPLQRAILEVFLKGAILFFFFQCRVSSSVTSLLCYFEDRVPHLNMELNRLVEAQEHMAALHSAGVTGMPGNSTFYLVLRI